LENNAFKKWVQFKTDFMFTESAIEKAENNKNAPWGLSNFFAPVKKEFEESKKIALEQGRGEVKIGVTEGAGAPNLMFPAAFNLDEDGKTRTLASQGLVPETVHALQTNANSMLTTLQRLFTKPTSASEVEPAPAVAPASEVVPQ